MKPDYNYVFTARDEIQCYWNDDYIPDNSYAENFAVLDMSGGLLGDIQITYPSHLSIPMTDIVSLFNLAYPYSHVVHEAIFIRYDRLPFFNSGYIGMDEFQEWHFSNGRIFHVLR